MEKKTYQKPALEVINIQLESIIASSPSVFTDPMPPESAGASDAVFDEEFDFLFGF